MKIEVEMMKRKILIFLICSIFLFSGCTIGEKKATDVLITETPTSRPQAKEEQPVLPFEREKDFSFSSGAGGWRTFLTLWPDGTFEGEYSDSELGETGEEYPDGSVYLCSFKGTFRDIEKKDRFTYSMKLDNLSYEEGEEWVEDGVRFIPSYPFGIADGETFFLYLPGKPTEDIPEGFLWWWSNYLYAPENQKPEMLDCYGIYNQEEETGFIETE